MESKNFMSAQKKDAVVIGAGPGGYSAAIRLGQLGKKALLADRDRVGGTCLNYGCIPSKAVIYFANLFEKIRKAEAMGLRVSGLSADLSVFQNWKNEMVKKLTGGIAALCKNAGVETIAGAARFISPHEIEIENGGQTQRIQSDHFIVATGTKPVLLPLFPLEDRKILTSKEALDLDRIPQTLLVIGGGVIGLELGTAFQKLGSRLVVVEVLDQLLSGFDPDLTRVVERLLKKRGAEIFLKTKAAACSRKQEAFEVKLETPEGEKTVYPDVILVAAGVRPNVESLDLQKAGVKQDDRGFIPADRQARTNVPHIFAIGDVNGPPYLAHKAFKEGETAAEVIAGMSRFLDYRALPWAVFTDPEIASVGLTEIQAQKSGREVAVGRFPLAASGRALSMWEAEGQMKAVVDRGTGEILGLHLVCAEASELIGEGALALEMGALAPDAASTIHPHPTLSEGIMEAFKQTVGEAVHIANLPDSKIFKQRVSLHD